MRLGHTRQAGPRSDIGGGGLRSAPGATHSLDELIDLHAPWQAIPDREIAE